MIAIVGAVLAAVFAALAALHVYWAAGGRLGATAVVPEVNGKATIHPGPLATLTAASLLLAACAFVAMRSGLAPNIAPRLVHLATCVIAITFALRAVGEFRTVGFFKKVRGTRFARWDTRFFSPLCVAIAAGCTFLALH
ncbi:MAG TPA: DUF3995 domain-containing protein [Polyangiaceae bacterium]